MKDQRKLQIVGVAILAILAYTFPFYGSEFFLLTIGVQSFFLAIVAMSLIFLAGFGGMLSLAQMSMYGVSAYAYSILVVSQHWPWPLAILAALMVTLVVSFVFGIVAVRTQGINFLMITLAQAMLFYYFAVQSRDLLGGFGGINGVPRPTLGTLNFKDPATLYLIALTVAVLVYIGLRYVARSPFGLALQAIRDNPRRMRSLGFHVTAHRVVAFVIAGLLAGMAGILGTWYSGAISPGMIDLVRSVNILVIAVLGGLNFVEGGFVGGMFFVLVTTFASSYTDRYNTLIGLSFLAVALFLPEGLTGLATRWLRGEKKQAGLLGERQVAVAQTEREISSVPKDH